MADRVDLSVQASQDQQNNSVKHQATVYLYFPYFKLYVYFGKSHKNMEHAAA